jgi:hypothetical protein
MKLIGLGHKALVGKDTTADYIKDTLRDGVDGAVSKIAFADEIKVEASRASGVPIHYFYDRELKDKAFSESDVSWLESQRSILTSTPRKIAQSVGAERRSIDSLYWIRKLHQTLYERGLYKQGVAIIPDVRMLEEAFYVKGSGGLLVRIDRTIPPTKVKGWNNHYSENNLDGFPYWDVIINNNGTFEDLYNQIKNLILSRLDNLPHVITR